MPESMTPVEKMKAAHDAEYARWCAFTNYPDCTKNWAERDNGKEREIFHLSPADGVDQKEFERMRDNASWRAALRALAEMKPTETMRGAVELFTEYDAFLWKGLILAAASEGEQE